MVPGTKPGSVACSSSTLTPPLSFRSCCRYLYGAGMQPEICLLAVLESSAAGLSWFTEQRVAPRDGAGLTRSGVHTEICLRNPEKSWVTRPRQHLQTASLDASAGDRRSTNLFPAHWLQPITRAQTKGSLHTHVLPRALTHTHVCRQLVDCWPLSSAALAESAYRGRHMPAGFGA